MMNKNPIIRLANEIDKNDVLTLLNSVFDEQQRSDLKRDDAFWNWKYKNNPFGKSTLTIVEYNKQVVGASNLWPWEFTCRGETLQALQPCDSAIHSDYRGRGLFTKTRIESVRIAREQGIDFLFSFPNQNSLNAYLNLGWSFMGRMNWHVKILQPINILQGKLSDSKSEVLPIPDHLSIDINTLEYISNRSQSFDSSIRIKRKEGFYNWRYIDHPTRNYGMVTWGGGSKPAIAAIFTLNQKGINTEMVIVDLIGKSENILDLFRVVVKEAKKLEVDFIALLQNDNFSTNRLWKLGFLNKKLKNMVVLPLDIRLEQHITNFKNWNMVSAIHDSI